MSGHIYTVEFVVMRMIQNGWNQNARNKEQMLLQILVAIDLQPIYTLNAGQQYS